MPASPTSSRPAFHPRTISGLIEMLAAPFALAAAPPARTSARSAPLRSPAPASRSTARPPPRARLDRPFSTSLGRLRRDFALDYLLSCDLCASIGPARDELIVWQASLGFAGFRPIFDGSSISRKAQPPPRVFRAILPSPGDGRPTMTMKGLPPLFEACMTTSAVFARRPDPVASACRTPHPTPPPQPTHGRGDDVRRSADAPAAEAVRHPTASPTAGARGLRSVPRGHISSEGVRAAEDRGVGWRLELEDLRGRRFEIDERAYPSHVDASVRTAPALAAPRRSRAEQIERRSYSLGIDAPHPKDGRGPAKRWRVI